MAKSLKEGKNTLQDGNEIECDYADLKKFIRTVPQDKLQQIFNGETVEIPDDIQLTKPQIQVRPTMSKTAQTAITDVVLDAMEKMPVSEEDLRNMAGLLEHDQSINKRKSMDPAT